MRPSGLRPPTLDAGIALGFVGLGIAEGLWGQPGDEPASVVVVACVAMATLAWRRRFPITVALVVLVADLVVNPHDQYTLVFALALVSFTTGAELDPPRTYVAVVVVAAPFVLAMVSSGLQPSDLAAALVFVVGPWLVGAVARQRAVVAEEAIARARRTEREADLLARLAVQEERTRIARELHDVVSHSISVLAIQAQAVSQRLHEDQVEERAALERLEVVAREAMAEMRRLFGVLRGSEEALELSPQPGLRQLAALLETVRASGLCVTHETRGTPYPLTAGLDVAAFRVVQESLTNVLRHARATTVHIVVEYLDHRLRLHIRDDGCGIPDPAPVGHGLPGLRERVELYGGCATVGRGDTGGTVVCASFPRPVGSR